MLIGSLHEVLKLIRKYDKSSRRVNKVSSNAACKTLIEGTIVSYRMHNEVCFLHQLGLILIRKAIYVIYVMLCLFGNMNRKEGDDELFNGIDIVMVK